MLGLRVAHELQIPSITDQKFTDDKGNVTIVKESTDSIANGNYLTSEGKQGDDAWSTRAVWCKMYGKMGNDSISVALLIIPAIQIIQLSGMHGAMVFCRKSLGRKNIYQRQK